jgi:hypothetical protein
MIKVISVAALITGMASASFAGSLNTNQDVVEDDVFVAAPSSAGIAIPLAIGGGLVALGLIASDSDDSATATTTGSVLSAD